MCFRTSQTHKKILTSIFFFTQSVRLSVTRLLWGGLKKFIKNLMCIKCVLGPQEPLKKFSRVIFFYSVGLSVGHTFVMGWVKKFIKNLMFLKCVLGPQEPLKKSHVFFFF